MRFLRDPHVRNGAIAASIALLSALSMRLLISNGADHIHYEVIGDLWGTDFGTWPDVFYTGADGDGEVFAVLAADPLGAGASQFIPSVLYRYSRIGFSLLGWVVSFGQQEFVLPALFMIGLAAAGAMGFSSGYLREKLGVKSWWLLINPAVYIGFVGDTAEPLAALLLVVVLLSSSVWASLALGVTRPTYASAIFGRWRLLAAVIAAAVLAQIAAVTIYQTTHFDAPRGNFALPFVGYLQEPSILGFVIMAAGVFTVFAGIRGHDLGWLTSGILVLVLGPAVLKFPINAVRAAGMLPVLWAFGPRWRPNSPTPTPQ